MKKENLKRLAVALGILGLFVFTIITSIRSCNDRQRAEVAEEKLSLSETSRDSLSKTWNKKSENWEYSRAQYQAREGVLKSELGKYSSRLDSLRKIKPKAETITVIETVTETDTLWAVDTVKLDGLNRPIYQYSIKDKFQQGTAIAYPDSLRLKLQTSTALVASMENGRLTVSPTNNNVKITGLEGFQVTQPKVKSKFWKGVAIGAGVGIIGGIILTR